MEPKTSIVPLTERSYPVDWPESAAKSCGCPDCLRLIEWVEGTEETQ